MEPYFGVQAMAYLVARRPIVNPHEGFMAQLEAFEVKLRRERDAAIADGQEKKVRPPRFRPVKRAVC